MDPETMNDSSGDEREEMLHENLWDETKGDSTPYPPEYWDVVENLEEAIEEGDRDLFDSLKLTKEIVNQRTYQPRPFGCMVMLGRFKTPLHFAVGLEEFYFSQKLLEHGADPNAMEKMKIGEEVPWKRTPLLMACAGNCIRFVELLLQYEGDPNKWIDNPDDDVPQTCLAYAIAYRNLEMVKILLEAGAEVKIEGRPAFSYLTISEDNFSTFVRRRSSTPDPLADIVRLLCEYGCDVNPQLSSLTPLMYAASRQDLETCQVLLRLGANVKCGRVCGNALHLCLADPFKGPTESKRRDLVQLLVAHGASLNRIDLLERTPLTSFLENSYMLSPRKFSRADRSIVRSLIQNGTILNEHDMMEQVSEIIEVEEGPFPYRVITMLIQGGLNPQHFEWLSTIQEETRRAGDIVKDYLRFTLLRPQQPKSKRQKAFYAFLDDVMTTPRSLQDQCVFYIRDTLISLGDGSSIKSAIYRLPLPEVIRDVVFLQGL